MNKLFGKSKRVKEKEKRAVEQKEENDFLYGRTRSSARGLTSADSVSAMDNQRTTVGTVAEAEVSPGSSLGGRGSRGDLKSAKQSPGNQNEQNSDWGAPQAPSPGGTGGGKTSGMSREEIDRLTKRRLKEERRKRGGAASMNDGNATESHARSQFEGRLSKSTSSPSTTDVSEENDNSYKSDRKYGYDEDNDVEERRRRHRERDEKDRKMKETIRQQRDAARDMRKSTKSHNEEQDERNRKMKKSTRKQREATKELHNGATRHKHNEDDELEERRRRRREQDEKDRKMKQHIREQRNAAKSMRSSSPTNEDDEQDRKMPHDQAMKVEEDADAKKMDHKRVSFNIDPRSLEKEEEGGDYNQNLIDLHLAQYLRASKIGDEEDEEGDNFPIGLNEFEEEEFRKNRERRMSRRISATTMKINAWQQKYSLKKAMQLAERTPEQEWASSFYRCDPRWQIMKFFDEVAREGGEAPMDENLAASPLANLFNKANVFTVWRPTSDEAIKNMMLGVATGKGLDIKGKSAKKGNISSYVPFIQIYEEPHKEHVHALIKDGRVIRIFYQTEKCRNEAYEMLLDVKDFMLFAAEDAMRVLSDEYADEAEQQLAMKHLMYDDTNLAVNFVDTYVDSSEPVFGLDITERLFWESYVMMQDCSRTPGTEWDIGRGSEPTFMDMNFKAIRHEPAPGARRAVVYQMSKTSPMEPRKLLMAYEEYGRVKPVVSDFDCFLLGSRGVKYKEPVPPEQVELLQWSVKNISEVLDERAATKSTAGWMETWFKVLKKAAVKGYYPKVIPLISFVWVL